MVPPAMTPSLMRVAVLPMAMMLPVARVATVLTAMPSVAVVPAVPVFAETTVPPMVSGEVLSAPVTFAKATASMAAVFGEALAPFAYAVNSRAGSGPTPTLFARTDGRVGWCFFGWGQGRPSALARLVFRYGILERILGRILRFGILVLLFLALVIALASRDQEEDEAEFCYVSHGFRSRGSRRDRDLERE
jgi:hypothetical protein